MDNNKPVTAFEEIFQQVEKSTSRTADVSRREKKARKIEKKIVDSSMTQQVEKPASRTSDFPSSGVEPGIMKRKLRAGIETYSKTFFLSPKS